MKINYSPLGGGTAVTGTLPIASGNLYVKVDGSRTMTGGLTPNASGLYSIGTEAKPFSSGCFGDRVLCSGIMFKNIASEFSLRNWIDTAYLTIAVEELRTATSGTVVSGAAVRFISSGMISWASAGTPNSDGTSDINLSRYAAGVVQFGTTTLNASGGLEMNSGVFTSGGVTVIGTHGSGVVIGVDNNGLLTVTGPFIYG